MFTLKQTQRKDRASRMRILLAELDDERALQGHRVDSPRPPLHLLPVDVPPTPRRQHRARQLA